MILTFATENYSHWLELLRESCKKNKIELKAYHLGWGLEPRMSLDYFSYSPERMKWDALMRLKLTLILQELLTQKVNLIWADADTIVLKNIVPLMDKLNDFDFFCTVRPDAPDQRRFAGGVLGFAYRQNVINYLARASLLAWQYETSWYADQYSLFKTLTKDIKHYHLTDDEHSLKGNTGTVFLSHHGNVEYEQMEKLVRK